MFDFLYGIFLKYGFSDNISRVFSDIVSVLVIFLIAFLAFFVAKKIVKLFFGNFIAKSKLKWDDIFFKNQVFTKIVHFLPATIIYSASSSIDDLSVVLKRFGLSYIIFTITVVASKILNAFNDIYDFYNIGKGKPIKGFIQFIQVAVYSMGFIAIIGVVIDKPFAYLISGIGALTAVLLIVFKDTLMSVAASVQLTTNNMVKKGDWIEIPKFGADGEVIDITLNIVKVQNWDKTITMVPTYSLISESFKNWKGMEESGGRRIKRSFYIDVNSIKFCDENMTEKFSKIEIIKDYIINKENEIKNYNLRKDSSVKANLRGLTNIGVFRIYLENYLKNNKDINHDMTYMVRQLEPQEKGLPLEIYCFSSKKDWVEYEKVQADIFDHIYSVIGIFELIPFQNPTGSDFKNYGENNQ